MAASAPDENDAASPADFAEARLVEIIDRVAPLLHAQATYRLGRLRRFYDPEDLVNDVWVRALPHLPGLGGREDLLRPVVLRFLTTTLQHRARDLAEKHLAGKPPTESLAPSRVSHRHSGVITRAVRGERADQVRAALATLDDDDRAVLVLRGIEQRSHEEVAAALRIGVDASKKRYQRALERLRRVLPEDLAGDFAT